VHKLQTEVGSSSVTQVRLLTPEVNGREVKFSWITTPESSLFGESSFVLKFPDGIDLKRVPESLLWRVALICEHSIWVLLEPCRIDIPIGIPADELDLWRNLIRSEWTTLNAYRTAASTEPAIEIVASGTPSTPEIQPASNRCATAFSGGKDSLVQTGLLVELTQNPVLVTITSPMPLLDDHLTERRRFVLKKAADMPGVQFVEIESDYRSKVDHAFAAKRGYAVSVNEMTDAFLYLGCLVIVAAACGANHLFLASEREVQENTLLNGVTVQHPHFMYSVVTQTALSRLLERWGLRYSSLISPLRSYHSQSLLVLRYAELWRLQYSCWRVRMGEAACNACPQCLRLAFGILKIGRSPSTIGFNLGRILRTMRRWIPTRMPQTRANSLPRAIVTASLHAQALRSILAVQARDVYSEIKRRPSKRLPFAGMLVAWSSFLRLRRLAEEYSPGPSPGYSPEFLEFVDPLLRDQVARIFASHFTCEDAGESEQVFLRSRQLTDWITSPIVNESSRSISREEQGRA
jgi:hypothetical protein